MPFVNGKWIHHNDCFWCIYQTELPIEIKNGQVKKIKEHCSLHEHDLPAPFTGGDRWCEEYVQKECGCTRCQAVIQIIQMDAVLDNCA
jgi:hypothetical protein